MTDKPMSDTRTLEKAREFLTNRFRMLTLGQQYEALAALLTTHALETEDRVTAYWDNYCTDEARPQAFEDGRQQERAAVVAYLRANEHAGQYMDFAAPIEKGEHVPKPKRKR